MNHERTLHLYGNISQATIAPIYSEIIRINNEDEYLKHQAYDKSSSALPSQPIHLYINSAGGNMYDSNTYLSAMVSSKTPIYTYSHGYIASAAVQLFVAGERRYLGRFGTVMVHQPSENAGEGKLFTLENRLEETKRLMDMRTEFICSRTKLTKEDFEKHKYVDWFMNAKEALAYGIINEII